MSMGTDPDSESGTTAAKKKSFGPMNTLKGAFLILCLGVALRETGLVQLDVFEAHWNSRSSKHSANWLGAPVNGEEGTLAELLLLPTVKSEESGIAEDAAAESLRKSRWGGDGPTKGIISFHIKDIQVTGLYWLPLYKSGEYEFDVKIQAHVDDLRKVRSVSMSVQGRGKFKVKGFCSIHKLRHLIGERIATEVEERVGRALQKH